jgi:hypothetical protein
MLRLAASSLTGPVGGVYQTFIMTSRYDTLRKLGADETTDTVHMF